MRLQDCPSHTQRRAVHAWTREPSVSMLTSRWAGIMLDIEPTDPVVELFRQARESSVGRSNQRVDLVCDQLNSKPETGAGRVPKECSPETRVGQQAAERPFHVTLTHASFPAPDAGKDRTQRPCSSQWAASDAANGSSGAAAHVNARI